MISLLLEHLTFDLAGVATGTYARGFCQHLWHRVLIAAIFTVISTLVLLGYFEHRLTIALFVEHAAFDLTGTIVGYWARAKITRTTRRCAVDGACSCVTTVLMVLLVG